MIPGLPGTTWLTPSAILPFARAIRLSRLRSSPVHRPVIRPPILLVQPADAALWSEVLPSLSVDHLVLQSWTHLLRVILLLPSAPHQFRLNLAGFSALLVTAPDSLKVWLLEPDFSLPSPHIGPAAPHLMAMMEGQS